MSNLEVLRMAVRRIVGGLTFVFMVLGCIVCLIMIVVMLCLMAPIVVPAYLLYGGYLGMVEVGKWLGGCADDFMGHDRKEKIT